MKGSEEEEKANEDGNQVTKIIQENGH